MVLRTHNVMRSRFTTFFMGYQVQAISRMDTSRYAHAHTHTHTHTELYIHIKLTHALSGRFGLSSGVSGFWTCPA